MLSITIDLKGDGAWPDLRDKLGTDAIIHVADGAPPIRVSALEGGLSSGRPSVAIRIDLPDGRTVIAETTARLFCATARAIEGRYPDLFKD